MTGNVYNILGLAIKAGRLYAGADVCMEMIDKEKAQIIILARDASENTKGRFREACRAKRVAFRIFGDMETLSKSIGKVNKAVIGINDAGFRALIEKVLDEECKDGGGVSE